MGYEKSRIIIIPSYQEIYALPIFLNELLPILNKKDIVIVCDDSTFELNRLLMERCLAASNPIEVQVINLHSEINRGRGGAVLDGLKFALKNYEDCDIFLEADADGSHTAYDIKNLLESDQTFDLIIGSRYLPKSKIIDWPILRSIFSKLLNRFIPKILKISTTDITNGLRRYNRRAASLVVNLPLKNKGFISLSEQLLELSQRKIVIGEIPIKFINRSKGKSSVNLREILKSVIGIIELYLRLLRK